MSGEDARLTTERILDTIESPCGLGGLSAAQLQTLAAEIREELIATVAKTGGHLAPNLGVVELTIGIHLALECPKDKIIWDVGHQSYVHKLLTGRRDRFGTLRQYGGLCGFPKRSESEYDAFDTGHASDSLSVAHGLALARDAAGRDETVVAVIGDGSLTGGMAFEAMNHVGHIGTPLVIVLNDNEMSIAQNVGALASYLAKVRLDPRYNRLRDDVESALARTRLGAVMVAAGEAAKESFKQLVVPGMLFEELGLKYVGPIDGHNIEAVSSAMERAKLVDGPVIIHCVTRKGAGYEHAEDKPDEFHGVGPFSVATGKTSSKKNGLLSYTEVFGRSLVAEAERDERIVAITAAMPAGTGLDTFAERFPERFFDVGIAEQHAVALAAGLALGGLRPVVAIYSTFFQRALDQIIHDICLPKLPVILAIDRGGVVGDDGPTHHGVFDLSFLRYIPNLLLMAPKDEAELQRMIATALNHNGPVAIRYPRGVGCGAPLSDSPELLTIGRGEVLREGSDLLLLPVGNRVQAALEAAAQLDTQGISCAVLNPRFIKPLDADLICHWAQHTGRIITVEDNARMGGFGSSVLELFSNHGLHDLRTILLGHPDAFVEHGPQPTLWRDSHIDGPAIVAAALRLMGRQ